MVNFIIPTLSFLIQYLQFDVNRHGNSALHLFLFSPIKTVVVLLQIKLCMLTMRGRFLFSMFLYLNRVSFVFSISETFLDIKTSWFYSCTTNTIFFHRLSFVSLQVLNKNLRNDRSTCTYKYVSRLPNEPGEINLKSTVSSFVTTCLLCFAYRDIFFSCVTSNSSDSTLDK